jgi:hypothetical protein
MHGSLGVMRTPRPVRARLFRPYRPLVDTSYPTMISGTVVLHPPELSLEEREKFRDVMAGYLMLNASFDRWYKDVNAVRKMFSRREDGRYYASTPDPDSNNDEYTQWISRETAALDAWLGGLLADAQASASVLMQRSIVSSDTSKSTTVTLNLFFDGVHVTFLVPSLTGYYHWRNNSIVESGMPHDAALAAFNDGDQSGRLVDWIRFWMRSKQADISESTLKTVRNAVARLTEDYVIDI